MALPNPFSDSDFAVGPRSPFEGPDATPTPIKGPGPTTPPGLGGALPPASGFSGGTQGGVTAPNMDLEVPQGAYKFLDYTSTDPLVLKYNEAARGMNASLYKSVARDESGQVVVDRSTGKPVTIANPSAVKAYEGFKDEASYWLTQIGEDIKHKRDREERADDQQEARRLAAETRASAATLQKLSQEFQMAQELARQTFEMGKLGVTQEFQTGERLGSQEFQTGQTILTDQLAEARNERQREFEGEQNALSRKLQELQLGINAGRLNLDTALGTLEKWLQGYQYSMPEGAQYTPGFQPGGAFQQASKLAGVSYNPANYKANTVPFDPAAVVRQTLGGG